MKNNKKYAIRKLAVGVVSVSIGFFVANASDLLNTTEMKTIGISEVKATEKGHLDSEPWTTTRYQEGMEITKDPGDKYNYLTDYKVNYVFKFRYFEEDGTITYRYLKTFTTLDSFGNPNFTYFAQNANDELPTDAPKSKIIGDKNLDYGKYYFNGMRTEEVLKLSYIAWTSVEPTMSETGEVIPPGPNEPNWDVKVVEKNRRYKGDKEGTIYPDDERMNVDYLIIGLKTKVEKEKVEDRKVKYLKSKKLKENERKVIVEGKDKYRTRTTEYDFKDREMSNEEFGEITKNKTIPTVENGEVKRTITDVYEEAEDKVIEVGVPSDREDITSIPSPIRYEKDDTREKGQENIVIKGKDGTKTTRTTYTVNPETGEVIPKTEKPVIVEPTETVIKVPAKDKIEIINRKDGKTYRKTTTYEVNKKTGEITETVKEELIADKGQPLVFDNLTELKVGIIKDTDGNILKVIKIEETPEPIDGYINTGKEQLDPDGSKVYIYKKTIETSKGTEKPPVVENKDFVGGVNPSDSLIREALPELKVAIIKDNEGNILDVIKLEEEPKEIKGYKNTGKTEVDKDGNKVYIYEKIKENKKPVVEDKKVNLKENNKEVIKKKEELPKTTASMLAPFGLLTGLALRRKKK